MRIRPKSRLLLGLLISVFTLLVPATAQAGRMIVTGHDTDVHCGYGSPPNDTGGHCHYIKVAVEYARSAAPDPTRKVLIVDCSGTFQPALGYAFNGAPPASDVVCPTDSAWAMTSLNTSTYSAMLVATSWNLTSEGSLALNERKTDIEAFFNQGGGIFANTSFFVDTYYDFLPLEVGSGTNRGPYSLTSAGQQIGLQDSTQGIGTYNDINCCATHNSFVEPAIGGPILVAERDADGKPMTLIAEGAISGGEIVAEPATAPDTTVDSGPPAQSNATLASFTFSSDTAGATFDCRLDEGEWSVCQAPWVAVQLADGPHQFEVRAVKDGVVDATPATHSWTVDTDAPDAPVITSGPGPRSTSDSASIEWTGEQGGHYTCEIDGANPVTCTSPLELDDLSEGEHTVKIRQIDAAGNESEPATRTWSVDTIAPSTSDDVPTSVQAGPVTVTLTPTDGGSGVDRTYYTTGVSPAAPSTESPVYDPDNKPVLADGESIRYYSVDLAGNAETERSAGPIRVGADLAVDVSAPATSWGLRRLTATTQVSNLGPANVPDTEVVLSVPDDPKTQVSQTGGPAFVCAAPVDETVSCTGALAMGETVAFTVAAVAPGEGTVTHSATADSESLFDPEADNDSDSASTELQTAPTAGGVTLSATATPRPTGSPNAGTVPVQPQTGEQPACRAFKVSLRGKRYRGARIRSATLLAAGQRLRSLHPENHTVHVEWSGVGSHQVLTVRLEVRLRSGRIVRVTRHAACTA